MRRNVLSLFSGIGGMDLGFEGDVIVHKNSVSQKEFVCKKDATKDFVQLKKNNFSVVFQNDILEGAKEVTLRNNPQKIPENYNTKSIFNLLEENFVFPDADVVIGGFPCQDFSHCGKRRGFDSGVSHDLKSDLKDNNSRGTLYKSLVDVVKRVSPKIFVAENVYGLLTMEGEPIKQIIADFQEIGYQVKYQDVYCPDFGIPQTRRRVIIMGIKTDTALPENWNEITKNKGTCHIGHYFKHLEEPDATTDISQMVYSKAKKLTKGQGQSEVNLKSFAPTMRAEHHGNIEFRRHANSVTNKSEKDMPERRLTVREAGLIQTFPPQYSFTTQRNQKAYKFIGNAVPPLLGYLIADKVNELLTVYG